MGTAFSAPDERPISVLNEVPAEMDDDQLVKINRQLEYEKKMGRDVAEKSSVLLSTSQLGDYKVPKVRFGKTGLMMPLVTCGGMRVQQTWCPDTQRGLGNSSMSSINEECQANLIKIIRRALSHGINHFETARMYGTSEMQYADALATMIESGEIKREDIIVQTKVVPAKTAAEFKATFEASWRHMKRLGYIDLFSFHAVSHDGQYSCIFENDKEANMPIAEEFKREGRLRNIGVSTHGSAGFIRKLIESDKFDYINLHHHFFGDYHAAGTPDGDGGQGNALNMKLAQDRDMGLFIISPFDKGGALYRPTAKVAELVGRELTPYAFAALWLWKVAPVKCHTLVVGAARPSDFDEVVAAARLLSDPLKVIEAAAAARRLNAAYARALGEAWARGWWKGIPDFFDPANPQGLAVGHTLWLHGLVKAFGMYDFAKDRYASMEATRAAWKPGATFEQNTRAKEWSGNPGCCWLPGDESLQGVLPVEAQAAVEEAHLWLSKKAPKPTDDERAARGWVEAYDLRPWPAYPGENPTLGTVVLQQLSFNTFGAGGGPTSASRKEAESVRAAVASSTDK